MTDEEVLTPEQEERLRRGLFLLAEETPAPGAARRRGSRLPALALGAAAMVAAVLAGPALMSGLNPAQDETSADSAASPMADAYNARDAAENSAGDDMATKSAPAPVAPPMSDADGEESRAMAESATADEAAAPARVMQYDLRMLVAESPRIVVGTVTSVKTGELTEAQGGLDYVMGTVEVEKTLRGPADARIVAFDYVYADSSNSAGGPQGATFAPGERVLLFLADTDGTVHDGIAPRHWQVAGGSQGKFAMNGAEPEAEFTLEGVRAEIERQNAEQ